MVNSHCCCFHVLAKNLESCHDRLISLFSGLNRDRIVVLGYRTGCSLQFSKALKLQTTDEDDFHYLPPSLGLPSFLSSAVSSASLPSSSPFFHLSSVSQTQVSAKLTTNLRQQVKPVTDNKDIKFFASNES